MIPHLGHLVKFASLKTPSTVSLLCDIHHYYVRNFFLFAIGLGLCRQIFGDSIVCHRQQQSLSDNFLETFCFVNGTFSETREWGKIHHGYYQWITVLFILEAFLSYAPYHVWLKCIAPTVPSLTEDTRDESVREFVTHLHRDGGKGLFWKNVLLECAYGCNLLLQALLANFWLNGGIWKGTPLSLLFPLIVKCHLNYMSGGDVTTGKFECLLPLNVLYLQIFIILHVSFFVLLVMHALHLLYRLPVGMCVTLRRGPFRRNVNLWWMYGLIRRNARGKSLWQLEEYVRIYEEEEDRIIKRSCVV